MDKMNYFLSALLAFLWINLQAQDPATGKITFEEKMDLHRNLPPERQDMADMIPQFNTSLWELIYQGDESVYQHKKADEEQEVTSNQGGAHMTMRFGHDKRIVYKNVADNQMVDSREFMQKQFLITDAPTPRKWKIGKDQKEILGYACFQATFQQDSNTQVTAWFTPQIEQHNGPSDYQGLPGMILQVDINNGERMVTATAIELKDVDTSVIVPPTKGKEVTAEEFKKIRDEKMKEMGIQRGGPGPQMDVHIIRN